MAGRREAWAVAWVSGSQVRVLVQAPGQGRIGWDLIGVWSVVQAALRVITPLERAIPP